MKVTAKEQKSGKTVKIVNDNSNIIANIILNGICWFEKIDCDEVYYGSNFDFKIDNIDEIKEHILLFASINVQGDVNTVHITVYNELTAVKELTFTNVR